MIPDTVQIGPHLYRVVLVPDGVMDDSGRFGHASIERLVIALEAEQPESLLKDTLMHECLHAMLTTLDLEDDLEERVILTLAPALLSLANNNPQLWCHFGKCPEN